MQKDWIKAERILKDDGVVVLPTDTLYGVIGSAMSKKVVNKIYELKGRTETKPFIVLINSFEQLKIFGIKVEENQAKILKKFWPGKVSIILPCITKKWEYIHRGVESIAFRMIGKKNKKLFDLINKVGPLVAPSANNEGKLPSETIAQAKKYFGEKIPLYIDGGRRHLKPSTLVRLINNNFEILRQGEVKIKT